MSFLFKKKPESTIDDCSFYLWSMNQYVLDEKRKEKCDNRYDDFLMCQKEYGFNDLKCRSRLTFFFYYILMIIVIFRLKLYLNLLINKPIININMKKIIFYFTIKYCFADKILNDSYCATGI